MKRVCVLLLVLALGCKEAPTRDKGSSPPSEPADEDVSPSAELVGIEPGPEELMPEDKDIVRNQTETVQFPSADGLIVTADLYLANPDDSPFILLFHQAGWSRGEYKDIAPKLIAMGFNCMAVDLRAGLEVAGVINETAKRAAEQKLSQRFVDTLPDMRAALQLVADRYPEAPRLLWGSSYSASLVITLASSTKTPVEAVIAFSPGEYFNSRSEAKSPNWIATRAEEVDVPVFISSTTGEEAAWKAIFDALPSEQKQSYLPPKGGHHGSRALWPSKSGSSELWQNVREFLAPFARR